MGLVYSPGSPVDSKWIWVSCSECHGRGRIIFPRYFPYDDHVIEIYINELGQRICRPYVAQSGEAEHLKRSQ